MMAEIAEWGIAGSVWNSEMLMILFMFTSLIHDQQFLTQNSTT